MLGRERPIFRHIDEAIRPRRKGISTRKVNRQIGACPLSDSPQVVEGVSLIDLDSRCEHTLREDISISS